MSTDEPSEGDGDGSGVDEGGDVRSRLEREADRAVEGFDEGIVDLLSWVLDTETRARIYVYLRQRPESTSQEVAEGTGLYPSTVREALAELHDEGKVTREKRANSGAGNNPFEYAAMAPSDLVGEIVEDVQRELNTVFNLDRVLGDGTDAAGDEPVTITVADGPAAGGDAPAGSGEGGEDRVADADGSAIDGDDRPDGRDGPAAGDD